MFNPFKYHLVKFKDGTYGVRRLDDLVDLIFLFSQETSIWTFISEYDISVAHYENMHKAKFHKLEEAKQKLEEFSKSPVNKDTGKFFKG